MKIIKSLLFISISVVILSCNSNTEKKEVVLQDPPKELSAKPDYFLLRPKLEKEYGYTHAVKIGHDIRISGAVSMDENGVLIAPGNMDQQMKNCYSDLEKILQHYGCTFDDVVVENVFTTNMADFIKYSIYRSSIYKKQFPTGSWLEVKGLALPGQLIEIELEAYSTK